MADVARLGKRAVMSDTTDQKAERDIKIVALRANGLTFDVLASKFNLSRERVRLIVRREEQRRARNRRIHAKWDGVFTDQKP